MAEQIKSEGPNSDEIDYWNGPQGKNWVAENRLTDLMYEPFGDKTRERAELTPGERILDIGCGWGTTTLKLAKLVAPDGNKYKVLVDFVQRGISFTAPALANSQAVELAKKYGDAESGKFVNGILDKISKEGKKND